MITRCPMAIKLKRKRGNIVQFAIYCRLCQSWNCPRGVCQDYLVKRWHKRMEELFNCGWDHKIYCFSGPVEEWPSLYEFLSYRKANFIRLDGGDWNRVYALFPELSVTKTTITNSSGKKLNQCLWPSWVMIQNTRQTTRYSTLRWQPVT